MEKISLYLRHHHERYDGDGYPDKLEGEDIPLGARIIAIADTFDAMTSDRPYRRSCTVEKALDEIQDCSGTQFDPVLVEAFVKVIRSQAGTDLLHEESRIFMTKSGK